MFKKYILLGLLFVAVENKPFVHVSTHDIQSNNEATQKKLSQAAHDGVFFLEIPTEIKAYVPGATAFAHSFYKDEELKKLDIPGFNGYFDREHYQIESFYMERAWWEQTLSKNIQQFALHTKQLLENLLQDFFDVLLPQLTKETVRTITSDVAHGSGLYHLSFNHYRPEKQCIGVGTYTVFGYITALFFDKSGLYVKNNGNWVPIEPQENYCLVLIGKALETLVNDTEKCCAGLNYVEQITEVTHNGDRISFALTADNTFDVPLYKVHADGTYEIVFEDYQKFLDDCFVQLYDK